MKCPYCHGSGWIDYPNPTDIEMALEFIKRIRSAEEAEKEIWYPSIEVKPTPDYWTGTRTVCSNSDNIEYK